MQILFTIKVRNAFQLKLLSPALGIGFGKLKSIEKPKSGT